MIRDRLPDLDRSVAFTGRSALALVLVLLVVAQPIAAANNTAINYDAGPNPYVHEDAVTIAEHDRADMGALDYYDDNDEIQSLPAHINESEDTPFEVLFSQVSDDDLHKFPRAAENVSIVDDESNWTTSGATVADGSTDVESVQISASAAGDTATYALDEPLDDADKRVLLSIVNVNSLATDAAIELRAVDSDGDYKALTIDDAGNTSDAGVMATEVGDGFVGQQKLNELAVAGSGDGSMDEIAEITVAFVGGTGDVTITGMDAERKSAIDLGEIEVDTDGDGELDDTETITEISSPGAVELTSLDSMGSWADDSIIYDLTVQNLHYAAEDLDSEDVEANFTDADEYANYPSKLDLYQRIEVPTAIDLSHSGLELRAEQKFVDERYKAVDYAEGVDDSTELTNVSDDDYQDVSGTYTDKGAEHVLDDTISPGENLQLHFTILLQSDDVRDLKDTESDGAGGGPVGESGGILSTLAGKVGATFAAVVAFVKGLPLISKVVGGS